MYSTFQKHGLRTLACYQQISRAEVPDARTLANLLSIRYLTQKSIFEVLMNNSDWSLRHSSRFVPTNFNENRTPS